MPLSGEGERMRRNFQQQYGSEEGKSHFYAYLNKHKGEGWESKVHHDRFRKGIRDALAEGVAVRDAIGRGISAAQAADEAGRKKFFKGIRDNVAKGLSPMRAIHDALGVPPFRG